MFQEGNIFFSKLQISIQSLSHMFCVEYAKSVKYTEIQRPVIVEDVIKAIKFKLNNEEQAFKKQHDETSQ